MPDVRNCKKCGKIYNYIGGAPICPACVEQDEGDFRRIKEYLYKNPGATMSEISVILEVSIEKITRFLKDGRLEIVGGEGNLVLECESCGKSIRTGRFCDDCAKGITNDLKSTAKQMTATLSQSETSNKSIGMRYLNKDGKTK